MKLKSLKMDEALVVLATLGAEAVVVDGNITELRFGEVYVGKQDAYSTTLRVRVPETVDELEVKVLGSFTEAPLSVMRFPADNEYDAKKWGESELRVLRDKGIDESLLSVSIDKITRAA